MEWYYYVIIAISVIVFTIFIIYSNNKITLSNHQIKSRFAPQGGLKIVHISDLHGKRFLGWEKYLIKKIEKQNPNFICITGDIIHNYKKGNVNAAKSIVKNCLKIAPVLYVCGNHELRNNGYKNFKSELISLGVTVLDDCSLNMGDITFFGVNDKTLRLGNLQPAQGNGYKILLAHEPQYLNNFARCGYDLVLCGHAHGGQWRIPFTGIGVYSPGQGLFPKYTSGKHTMGATQMIVSRGLGNSEFPLRLFNTPEVVVIKINRS